jgi:hypothetical protein
MSIPERYRPALECAVHECRAFFGDNLRSVALFGSVARGTPRPDSDIDLLVVVDDAPSGMHKRAELLLPLIQRIEASPSCLPLRTGGRYACVSLILRSRRELEPTPWLLIDLVEDAVLLVDDDTLGRKLEALRSRLQQLGACRVTLPDGSWYWDLKPDLRLGEAFEL